MVRSTAADWLAGLACCLVASPALLAGWFLVAFTALLQSIDANTGTDSEPALEAVNDACFSCFFLV